MLLDLESGVTDSDAADVLEWFDEDEAEGALDWLRGIGTGAAGGAAMGATAGPWGALVGGLVGAGLGALQTATQQSQPQPTRPAPPRVSPRPAAPTGHQHHSFAPPSPGPAAASTRTAPDTERVIALLNQVVQLLRGRPAAEGSDEHAGHDIDEGLEEVPEFEGIPDGPHSYDEGVDVTEHLAHAEHGHPLGLALLPALAAASDDDREDALSFVEAGTLTSVWAAS